MAKYVIGVDLGTESGRAVLVDVADGRVLGSAVELYRNVVIDQRLPAPHGDVVLPPDWALQDPEDYLRVLQLAVPAAVREAGVDPRDVIGLGVDVTSCTMLPVRADGTALAQLPAYQGEPHAWVKLWKHHAAQPQADRINEVARALGEPWLERYGGRISSEWFFAKSLQILEEALAICDAADRLMEATDWIVWRLTDVETRNACTAGYKAMWSKATGFPNAGFFGALDPRFATVVDRKKSPLILQIYADVTGKPIAVSGSEQTPALGAAMFRSVAAGPDAGGHATIEDAARAMARTRPDVFRPNAESQAIYDVLYREYLRLHDYFGRGENDVMKTLRSLRASAKAGRPATMGVA